MSGHEVTLDCIFNFGNEAATSRFDNRRVLYTEEHDCILICMFRNKRSKYICFLMSMSGGNTDSRL